MYLSRTRKKDNISYQPWHLPITDLATGQLVTIFSGTVPTFSYNHEIHDNNNSKNVFSKLLDTYPNSDCVHVKMDVKHLFNGPHVWIQDNGRQRCECHFGGTGAFQFHPDTILQVSSDFFNLPPGFSLEAKTEALNHFMDQVPEVVSIPNFLYELREFKSLKPKLSRKFGDLNDNFLSYNFGWKPMIGDLVKFTQVLDTITKRMEWLRTTRGKPQKLFYRKVFNDSSKEKVPVIYAHYLQKESYKATFTSGCELYHELDGLDDAWAFLRAMIKGTGFSNPAKIYWNAVPLSFMVDWVVPVNTLLERLAVQPFAGRWEVYNTTHSFKEEVLLTHHFNHPGDPANPDYPVAEVKISRYSRTSGLNLTLADIQAAIPDIFQQVLASSICYGRMRK